MLRALTRFFRRFGDEAQLSLSFDAAPRDATELLDRLRALGLRGIERCTLTRNRTVMVSYRDGELRVHEGYLDAPTGVHEAIVRFVTGRTHRDRREAQREVLAHHIERPGLRAPGSGERSRERTHAEDAPAAAKFAAWHGSYNARFFGGRLRSVPVRISRRMRSRLGHYTAASPAGTPAEIVISRNHVRRHGWEEALHTLLHEMVHQWQDEQGHAIDHGRTFRAKARELGITPSARRVLTPRRPAVPRVAAADRARPHVIGLQAAREDERRPR